MTSWFYATASRGGSPSYWKLTRDGYCVLHGSDAVLPKRRYFEEIALGHHHHFNFVIELDNGTERIRSPQDVESIERKVRGYDLHQSGTPSFDHGRFVVLFVTTRSSERLAHILQAATRIMRNPRRTLFLGVTLSAFLNHDMPLTAPLFMSPTGRQQSLVPNDSTSRQTLSLGQLSTASQCLESHRLRLTKMRGTPPPVSVVA